MNENVGTVDRYIRAGLALLIVVLYYFKVISGDTAMLLGLFSIFLAITSFVRICPIYWPFKFSTVKKEKI